MHQSWKAFHAYRKLSLKQRADFMRAIAAEIENLGDELLKITGEETNLPEARLRNERARTMFQLTSYAEACERGEWLEARIDTAIADRNPPKPDIRKMLVPLGPVVVFGASNFPFAYSTREAIPPVLLRQVAPVVVKAHPAHAGTSTLVATAIAKAAEKNKYAGGCLCSCERNGNAVGEALIKHPLTKAVGFTGSFMGGKQL